MDLLKGYLNKHRELIMLFLIAVLVEVFVFNVRSFQTMGYTEKTLDSSYGLELIGGSFTPDGDIVMNDDAEYVIFNITGFDYPLNSIRLDVECIESVLPGAEKDPVCVAECSTFDDALFEQIGEDGASYFVNGAVTSVKADIVHDIKESHYIYLEPFGNTHKLQIILYPEAGVPQILRIDDLVFNAVKPMNLNPLRIAVIFVLLLIIYFAAISPVLWKEDCISPKKWKSVVIIGSFVLFAFFAAFWMLSNKDFWNVDFSPYNELARAIASGRLYVGEASDTVLATEGKSVFWRGDSTEVMFDYVLYGGKYYVYFGILPCIIFYLPYYLVSGNDLPDILPGLFLRIMLVALVGRLIWIIVKKYYKKTPVALFLLMWAATVCGMYIPVLMTEMVMFYDIPILSGAVLTMAGICLMLDTDMSFSRKNIIKLVLGSICLASVSLCRPTMLLYGFVVIGCMIWNHRSEIRENVRSFLTVFVVPVAVPYAFFAAVCMAYNAARFGSPFDFGASYNATTYPIEGASLFIPYVVARAAYEYLLRPPLINFGFPFTKFDVWEKVRVAGNIMVVHIFVGGILAANPFTWSLAFIGGYRQKLKEKKIFYFMLLCFALALFLMVYGVLFTSSVYTRYTVEFSPVFFVCSCVIMMEIYESITRLADERLKNMLRTVIALVLLVSLAWGMVQLFCAETGSAGLVTGNSELWYRMKYVFRIF